MKLFYEHFIKLAHIGKGANAHVYKVRHADLGYVRAIKVLNDHIENKRERTYLSFLKECKTLLAIGNGAHPNIVRIYGPDLIDNHAIVEMDYVQGLTLDSYIKKKGAMDYAEIKTFIHDIVGALAYTHHDIYKFLMDVEEDDLQTDPNDGQKFLITPEKEAELVKKYGIAHNDLHSNNVMRRDYDGRFILLDFGLAVQDGECIKSSRKSDGSPEYKAPEKFDSGEITSRSDVYSLGVLIYEVLTGRPPFVLDISEDGKVSYPALSKICEEHRNQTPPPILPLRKAALERKTPGIVYERDYPEWLDEIVMKCLSKNPADRFNDAKELFDIINGHMDDDQSDLTEINSLKQTISDLTERCEQENAQNDTLYKQLNNAKQEKDRLLRMLSKASSGDANERVRGLNERISKLTKQWEFQKQELEYIIETQNIDLASIRKKWKGICGILMIVSLCLIIGIWLYQGNRTKSLSSEPDTVLGDNSGQEEYRYKQTIDSLQSEISVLMEGNDSKIIASLNGKIDAQASEIDNLNQQIDDLKKQKPKTETKIEYRTSPEDKKELTRLRNENKNLAAQITDLKSENNRLKKYQTAAFEQVTKE